MTRPNGRQLKKEICQQFGIKANLISVRYDGSYDIILKDFAIDANAVKEYASKYESVHRDAYSGEILCGGNTFVFVDYSYDSPIPEGSIEKVKERISRFNFGDINMLSKEYHIKTDCAEALGFNWKLTSIILRQPEVRALYAN